MAVAWGWGHDQFRHLTQASGVLEAQNQAMVVHLLPRVRYPPRLRRIIGEVLEGINERRPVLPDGTGRRLLFRLLVKIRRQWAKEQADAAVDEAREAAEAMLSSLNLRQPRIPTIPGVIGVKSSSQRGVVYSVDLSGPNCTCPDWRSHRRHLPEGHLSRCCKHVLDAFGEIEPESGWPGWLGGFIETAVAPHPQKQWAVAQVGRSLVLVSSAPTGWADVFAFDMDRYERFGFNPAENRWAYGAAPDRCGKIQQAIASIGPPPLPGDR